MGSIRIASFQRTLRQLGGAAPLRGVLRPAGGEAPGLRQGYAQVGVRALLPALLAVLLAPSPSLAGDAGPIAMNSEGAPDLIVENMQSSLTSPSPNQLFTLMASVRNQGDAAAAATRLRFYASADARITTQDSRLADRPIGALDPGQSQAQQLTVKAPLQAGRHYYGACAGPVEGEVNATARNQCSAAALIVVSVPPDAGETRLDAMPIELNSRTSGLLDRAGDVDYYRLDIPSEGPVLVETSGATDTHGQLHGRDGRRLHSDDDSGEGGNFRIERTLAVGVHYIRVSGSRRAVTGPYQLAVRHMPNEGVPDLIPQNPLASSEQPSPGRALIFRVDVRNQGAFPSAQTTARFFLSTNDRITSFDKEVATATVPAVAGQASVEVSAPLYAPTARGRHYFGICIDGAQGEKFTDNNCSQGVRVTVGEADIGTYSLPLVLAASEPNRESFIRIANLSNRAGQVRLIAWDDSGVRSPASGAVTLSTGPLAISSFNSGDLEQGNVGKGLASGIGAGQGSWRLRLETDLDILPLAYVRTRAGFVAAMHRLVTKTEGRYEVGVFHPASNANQVSRLRLANPGALPAELSIIGYDSSGARAPAAGAVRLTLPGGEALGLTAQDLEQPSARLTGSLGAGIGNWRLYITASQPIEVMNLLDDLHTGNLANLSNTASPGGGIPLFLSAGDPKRASFVRLVNRSARAGEVAVQAIDDAGVKAPAISLHLPPLATAAFNSMDLEQGNPDKGLAQGVGPGEGDWRLLFSTDLDILPLAYVRTDDGFVTSMHEVSPGWDGRYQVPFLNPASNTNRVSRLRLINPGNAPAEVAITGLDSAGNRGASAAALTIPPGQAVTLTAADLEQGAPPTLAGALGDGVGKWRLSVSSSQPIELMSLVDSVPTGALTNLSAANAGRRIGERFKDCAGCPEMVVIPSGIFQMGAASDELGQSEKETPRHRVRIPHPLAVSVHEVTFAHWRPCWEAGVCAPPMPGDWGQGRQPAINLSWQDAQAYIGWLNETTGQAYRLLSEAEWEYAARAGAATPFHTGHTISTDQANYNGNLVYGDGPLGVLRGRPIAVGSLPANAFGLHDMLGNVQEWVQDCWTVNYASAPGDGAAVEFANCADRTIRGGAWNSRPQDLRSASRHRQRATTRNDRTGFRLARPLTRIAWLGP